MSLIHSPFRYPGGKFRARSIILKLLPDHSSYLEPFAGGASIFFAKEKSDSTWLNDRDEELINTLLHIRDQAENLIKNLEGLPALQSLHTFYKTDYVPSNNLERAMRYFYLNRTSYSGIMNPSNCYWGYGDRFSMRPENWPRAIRRASLKLQNVVLTSEDFETIIEQAPTNSFLFIDPPYYNAQQAKFYKCSFQTDDHLRLQACLTRHADRIKFLLTYDCCEPIQELYKDFTQHTQAWNYSITRADYKNGNRKRTEELFISNY